MASRSVFIVSAKRTPFGTFGGKLKDISATTLAVYSSKSAISAAKIDPAIIDSVIMGNVAQTSDDAAYLARHVCLKSGLPIHVPAFVVNRLCGSGFQAIVSGAQEIIAENSSVVLVGGTENMTQAPFAARGLRFGNPKFGENIKLEDTLWQALTDSYPGLPMAITAENLAEKYSISRQECDEFALRSQKRWNEADQSNAFQDELAPIELQTKKGTELFTKDEHPRPNSTIEALAKLSPVFKKGGTVTAGNASGICDGAASLIIASEDAVKKHKLTPLARLVTWSVIGVDPSIMGIGPAPAIRNVLARTKLTMDKIDLIEINEAFAAQSLAVLKELGNVDTNKVNVCGGAIALGHPLAASGARITTHLVHQLHKKNLKYAIGSACIGGGQGIAVVLERV